MSTGGGSHYADAVRVKTALLGLRANDPNGALDICSCSGMLRERRRRARSAILHSDYRHTLLVQVATNRRNLKTVGTIAHV